MKFGCECGATIYEITDNLPYKAWLIRDREWDAFWNAVDDAVEKSGPTAKEKEDACMGLRSMLNTLSAFQCSNCGRLHIVRQGQIKSFVPETPETSKDIFK
jgi:predicted RNA-binding Zn-ribbon protein involved in translation (DUF1610 family)